MSRFQMAVFLQHWNSRGWPRFWYASACGGLVFGLVLVPMRNLCGFALFGSGLRIRGFLIEFVVLDTSRKRVPNGQRMVGEGVFLNMETARTKSGR